ncbi:MAG: ATP-binding protein [Vicinamibacterales bacterium]
MTRTVAKTMHERHLTVGVNHDHLSGLTRCHPSVGIAELIWNSLDADATRVNVWLREGPGGGVERVEVDDNGTGIDVTRVDQAFESLGGSWKASKKVSDGGRVLHGRAGKGRFRAGSIGRMCRWSTVNRAVDSTIHAFGITISTDNLKDAVVEPSEKEQSAAEAGTRVVISEILSPYSKALEGDALRERLTEEFGPYLLQYPGVKIAIDGELLDATPLINEQATVLLPPVSLPNGKEVTLNVRMVEWKGPAERRIFLCDASGTTLVDVPMRSHLLDGYVTAYAHSDQFRELQVQDLAEGQVEQLEEVRPLLAAVRESVKEFVRKRLASRSQASVARWKEEKIYPYQGEAQDEIEAVEREVYDIVAVQLDRFLPKIKGSANSVKRMHFSLLRATLESQPEDVVQLLDALAGLPAQERKMLVDLLQRTTLSNIIRAAKLIDDRLHFLRGLEAMLADKDLREAFLERSHLHEMLAKNTWIFGDAYSLTVSDESLTEVVKSHIEAAKLPIVVDEPVVQSDGRSGRVDLMLTRALGAPAHSREHLVIELKRPTVTGGEDIVSQAKRYARAVARDARWADTKTTWTFWAIAYDLDDDGRAEINQPDRPHGRVDAGANYTVWLRTWGALLEDCRGRLTFLRDALAIETKKEAGVRHLQQAYPANMPEIVEDVVPTGRRLRAVKRKRPAKKARPAKRRVH